MRIVITGGAGFVGSNLACLFRRDLADCQIVCLDNLRRRGSELILKRLKANNIEFCHGDIRNREDIESLGPFDLLIDCSAEPSVHAGYGQSPLYVINTNLMGTINCLEAARMHQAAFLFLSTSRVYPIQSLRSLPLEEMNTRMDIMPGQTGLGWSPQGISAAFPLEGHRSIYGATKLSSELIIQEYVAMYGLRAVINRCGVLTGPWQMGSTDQGFVVLWAARHQYNGKLNYSGFGGKGLQVRDILHVEDLYELLRWQISQLDNNNTAGQIYNVGGGPSNTVSLAELTGVCRQISGRKLQIASVPETRSADIPYYVSDNTAISSISGWKPQRSVDQIMDEVFRWLVDNQNDLKPILS